MKNVFFSILVLFMLAFSMLGNVNLVKADIAGVTVSNPVVSPQKLVLGQPALEIVEVTVTITNNNIVLLPVELRVTSNIPTNANGEPLQVEPLQVNNVVIVDGILDPLDPQQTIEASFEITKRPNTVAGTYNGAITITELLAGVPTVNTIVKDYSVIVESLNKKLSATGLNEDSEFEIISEEDNTVAEEITLQNIGNVELSGLSFKVSGTFTDGTETIGLKAKFGSDANALYQDIVLDQALPMLGIVLAPQATSPILSTSPISLQVHVPQDLNLDTYTGNIVILDSVNQPILTIPLVLKIEPEICSEGIIGNLKFDITDPDNGDDFKIGDEIPISVEVDNKDNKDLNVVVEAILYDLDRAKKIESIESDSLEIEKGTAEDFDLTMIVPNDEDIDPDNNYILYIKASEDGDENLNCVYKSIDVDLERDDDDVRITTLTVTPSIASQGSMVSFSILVENIGTDDQKDAYIKLTSTELGLDLMSSRFDVKKYDKSGNDRVETLTFTVPVDKTARDYTIEAFVYDSSGRQFDNGYVVGKLTVQGEAVAPPGEQPPVVVNPPVTGPGTYTTGRSVFDSFDTKTLFIVGDIVLVILAVLFLILIFRRR